MQANRERREQRDDALARAADQEYEARGLARRADVARLRLRDGLPAELTGLGGRRPVRDHPGARRQAALEARAHLLALGLYSDVVDAVLRASA